MKRNKYDDEFLYDPKPRLMSEVEEEFFEAIKEVLPEGFLVFPQVNLAAFIERTDSARYRGELFRNVDFLVTDEDYLPRTVIEINDSTHHKPDRRERDERVRMICEEAGIPMITLWTSYGVKLDYIEERISDSLYGEPPERIHHFERLDKKKKGCYIATCVYGSYDCPQVRVLRRFRDLRLAKNPFGRAFIRLYYAVSPTVVRLFGEADSFRRFFKNRLDRLVARLMEKGFEDSEYNDI